MTMTTTEATAAASASGGSDDRRKKRILLQKRKARNEQANKQASSPEPAPPAPTSPSFAGRSTTSSISLARRQILKQKRRSNKSASPTVVEKKVDQEEEEAQVVLNVEEKKEHSPKAKSEETTKSLEENTAAADHAPAVEANTAISEDRNDKVEQKSAWDTRSIHEFPPEPAVDPTWDASKTALFTQEQDAAIEKQMEAFGNDDNLVVVEEFHTFENGTFSVAENTETSNDKVGASPMDKDEETTDKEQGEKAIESVITNRDEASPSKLVDCSMDVQMGLKDDDALAAQAGRLLESSDEAATALLSESKVTTKEEEEVDFSATDLNNPANILKDDEALLESDQVRSDVADGAESTDKVDAIRLLNQVEQQKRIEQYQVRGDDSSSVDDDDESLQEEEKDPDDDDEEVRYVSADSSDEEEEDSSQTGAFPVFDVVGETSQGATFDAAAAAAARDASATLSPENLKIAKSGSSSSGSAMATAVESSVASSALIGAGVLSLTGASELTDTTVGGDAPPPPPPPLPASSSQSPPPPPAGQPPPKKKSRSKGKNKKQQTPLLKIPPPAPDKLRKWEEEKMRPYKHLQAVQAAKDGVKQEHQLQESAPSSEHISLSLMTSVSSSHSQDEIETTLDDTGLPEELSTMIAKAERATQKRNEIVGTDALNESQVSQRTHEMSFPDARSVERDANTSIATSSALLSPPHVSRTTLDDAAGLAPGEDGVWKEENVKKTPKMRNKSPLSHDKMAEKLAVASSTAARKFEERFGTLDEEEKEPSANPSFDSMTKNKEAKDIPEEARPDLSYFCAPDMLGGTSFCQPSSDEALGSSDGNLLSHLSTQAKEWASRDSDDKDAQHRSILDSSFDDTHHAGMELVGGAFSTWKNSDYAYASDAGTKDPALLKKSLERAVHAAAEDARSEEVRLLSWLENDVLGASKKSKKSDKIPDTTIPRDEILSILEKDAHFNTLCGFASVNVILPKPSDDTNDAGGDEDTKKKDEAGPSRTSVYPFLIPTDPSKRPSTSVLAANFISFLNRISLLSGVESPFKDENPFLADVVNISFQSAKKSGKNGEIEEKERSVQDLIFEQELGDPVSLVRFFYHACGTTASQDATSTRETTKPDEDAVESAADAEQPPRVEEIMHRLYKIPTQSPSPFETASWNLPSIVAIVLGFLGDPVAVCRMKQINHFCNRLIQENEHVMMRDAVRLGGIGMHIRPAFWMWITLEKCGRGSNAVGAPSREGRRTSNGEDEEELRCITTVLPELEKQGREGKWHHVIQRDVARAFGNMPPHKTGARLRTDSIVRALVTWGRGRVLSRGVKGGGVSSPTPVIPPPGNEKPKSKPRPATGPPPWERGDSKEEDSQDPPDTVSQWSGISPVPSFCSNSGVSDNGSAAARANLANGVATALEQAPNKQVKNSRAIEELALSGNTLTTEMKEGLQNQLGYILHALAAAHEDVGYCQGMDYVVAHLLRVLQDTVRYHSVRGTLSPVIKAQPQIPKEDSDERSLTKEIDQAIDASLVVEETVFRVMDTFLTTYNLRHMYWPELRCLKTCCRVFERLIQMKLPVLADHFAYHELNVGLFALGWFQTLFLYLPSMPSATVCHMWDIWLVERSFKIFFRVGTAILFLSQPILLNHELEGMMTYLNTFPDATLLNPDILIACALQIKVTNRMLEDIERDL